MIKLLDKATIDKIAAGEVIERPSSVVKELLENSVDAHSTSITVEIKEGGLSFIRVTDNGCGIPKEEVKTAYLRHATSKINDADDLYAIHSLGFRGEALSTIAAVSMSEMITKTADELTGIKYEIHGGEEISCTDVGVPNGTTVVVRDLFYNTPARKKFLKSAMTEGSYIQDLVLKIALSHPEIAFKLIINGQTKMDTPGNGNVKDVIYQLYGREIASNLIEFNTSHESIKITGYIGKPFISRGNRGFENYYINNRFIKSNIVNRAIEEGYRTFVMQHKFPFTALFIELPPEQVDVNVHPTKMEFKYDKERELFEVISRAIREALTHKEMIPKDTEKSEEKKEFIPLKPAEPFEINRQAKAIEPISKPISQPVNKPVNQPVGKPIAKSNPTDKYSESYHILEQLMKDDSSKEQNIALNLLKDDGVVYQPSTKEESKEVLDENAVSKIPEKTSVRGIDAYKQNEQNTKVMKEEQQFTEVRGVQSSMFDDNFLTENARKKHRIIGQLFETYWLIQYENNLYIIDQHAAHEKVKYEELMATLKDKEVYSQQLMPPMVVSVSHVEYQAVLDNFDLFFKLGYDIEEFGGHEFKINAVPSNLYGIHGKDMFIEFVNSLVDNSGYMSNDIFVRKLSTMACKAAIKGNTKISIQEAEALIDNLLKLENPYTCPHGRPTIISISEQELEKKFKRIV